MKQSFAERAKLVGPLNATTPRADNSVTERQGQLIYLQPGDVFAVNDVYEHYRHNLGVRVVGGPYVAGITSETLKPGDQVTEDIMPFQPRRYIAA